MARVPHSYFRKGLALPLVKNTLIEQSNTLIEQSCTKFSQFFIKFNLKRLIKKKNFLRDMSSDLPRTPMVCILSELYTLYIQIVSPCLSPSLLVAMPLARESFWVIKIYL